MKVLLLCGVFAKENEQEIISHAKRPVEYSANIFQEKLVEGFNRAEIEFSVLSAPFIGSYPNASDVFYFRKFSDKQDKYQYVPFFNVWGVRNYSRAGALKRALKPFIEADDQEKLIVLYSPHTPFLEAAVYAKKKDPRIKIHLIVPDLPQYMNLNAKKSILYRVGKQFDIKKFNRLNQQVNSYMLLTEAMKEKIDIHGRPYIVVEGLVTEAELEKSRQIARMVVRDSERKYIVYTGKLNEKFGVRDLVDAFLQTDDPEYRLVLCGKGDTEAYVREKSGLDTRIMYLGQVTAEAAREWMYKADVLVNPRKNDEEYTKYSFPSKNIEYLLTGNPVVAYQLDGMPDLYGEFMEFVGADDVEALKNALERGLKEQKGQKSQGDVLRYFKENISAEGVAKRILRL